MYSLCPVCGRHTYKTYKGEYDREEFGQGKKLSPDFSICSNCGFSYEENIRVSEKEMADRYKKNWRKINA